MKTTKRDKNNYAKVNYCSPFPSEFVVVCEHGYYFTHIFLPIFHILWQNTYSIILITLIYCYFYCQNNGFPLFFVLNIDNLRND